MKDFPNFSYIFTSKTLPSKLSDKNLNYVTHIFPMLQTRERTYFSTLAYQTNHINSNLCWHIWFCGRVSYLYKMVKTLNLTTWWKRGIPNFDFNFAHVLKHILTCVLLQLVLSSIGSVLRFESIKLCSFNYSNVILLIFFVVKDSFINNVLYKNIFNITN